MEKQGIYEGIQVSKKQGMIKGIIQGVEKSILVYPHEFEISKTSGFEVYVVNNHFKGSHYLIEGLSNNGLSVFFINSHALQVNTQVFLNVSLQLVNKRLSTD